MKKLLLSIACGVMASTAFGATLTEVITIDSFKLTVAVNNYTNVSYTSPTTGITYEGNLCQANGANGGGMQFRTTSGKEAGLVATKNPNNAVIKSVTVQNADEAPTANQWDVYGSNTMYTNFKDLFDTAKQGTLIGNGKDEPTLTSNAGYIAFGLRANKGAIYLKKITIVYDIPGDEKEAAGLAFSESNVTVTLGEEFTAPTLSKETDGAITYSSSDNDVAVVDSTGKVTIKAIGIATITATAAETDTYYGGAASYTITVVAPVIKAQAQVVTEMSNGKFALVTPEGVAKNFTGAASATYGYLFIDTDVKATDGAIEVNEDYLITFTSTDKGYTMVDNRGKFLGMDATHFGSFNFYADADATGSNCYWNVTFEGNEAKIENAGRAGAFISYKQYGSDWELATTDDTTLPATLQLFKSGSVGVDQIVNEISAENAAPVYYNLQGVRVEEPANGLYIVRRGDKVAKEIGR